MQNSLFETEKLGCYYFLTFYPANLTLPEKASFSFEFDSKTILVLIHRHLKAVILNDFANKIIRSEENGLIIHTVENDKIEIGKLNMAVEIENGGYFIVDHTKHLHKEIYTLNHTEIILNFETTSNQDNYEFSKRALDFFIKSYRLVSQDVITLHEDKIPFYTKIYKYDFHFFSNEELKLPKEDRLKIPRGLSFKFHQISIPFWANQGKKITTNPETIVENLQTFFKGQKKTGALNDFILRASEELHVHKNYKYSLIESWTALEIAIVSYLKEIKLSKNISKNKIEDYEGRVGISYLINIELPLIHPSNDQVFKDLILNIDLIRKLRNKVIHDNKNVSEDEAANAIKVLIEFLNYIGYKKY